VGRPVDAPERLVDEHRLHGMPSGIGVSGPTHSSVQAERSWRAGLPVRDRERTVSADVAARNFSLTTGWVSASSVVSHTEPHHTPAAPSDLAPAPMPPAPITGAPPTASTTSGRSTMVAIWPVWPPAS
jgi:hypothetical protein